MTDEELLRRMVLAVTYNIRCQAMATLTERVRNGAVSRDVCLMKGYLQLLDLRNSTEEQRVAAVRRAEANFKLRRVIP